MISKRKTIKSLVIYMIEETLLIIATLKQTMNFIDQQVRKKKKKKTYIFSFHQLPSQPSEQ
jgi:hypothetical protein